MYKKWNYSYNFINIIKNVFFSREIEKLLKNSNLIIWNNLIKKYKWVFYLQHNDENQKLMKNSYSENQKVKLLLKINITFFKIFSLIFLDSVLMYEENIIKLLLTINFNIYIKSMLSINIMFYTLTFHNR